MSRFAHFNVNETTAVVCSVPINDGKAPDAYIEFEFPDDWEEEIGADGLVIRCATGNSLVKAKLKLLGSSTDNDKLSTVQIADLSTPGGAGVGTFLYKDNNGTTNIASDRCWLFKRPNFSNGTKPGPKTWDIRFIANPGSIFIGGNSIS
jgi:hypothetical protein